MAIGRTFKEAFLKGFRSLELGRSGQLFAQSEGESEDDATLQRQLAVPTDRRLFATFRALQRGWTVEQVHDITKIDRWFLSQFLEMIQIEQAAGLVGLREMSVDLLTSLKRSGFSDADIAVITGTDTASVFDRRKDAGLRPVYKRIDTCAAEFESFTPYQYGTYEKEM